MVMTVMTDLWDVARQAGLRGVILGWMGCILLAQRDSTEEGTVREVEQTTVAFYWYIVPTPFFFSPSTRQFYR